MARGLSAVPMRGSYERLWAAKRRAKFGQRMMICKRTGLFYLGGMRLRWRKEQAGGGGVSLVWRGAPLVHPASHFPAMDKPHNKMGHKKKGESSRS
jgi:hypothetical protein